VSVVIGKVKKIYKVLCFYYCMQWKVWGLKVNVKPDGASEKNFLFVDCFSAFHFDRSI